MKLQANFFTNVPLKLLSLLLAAVLWLFVTLETADEIEIPLVINLVNVPSGFKLQNTSATWLSLRIAGPRILLLRQRWQGAQAVLDLYGADSGRATFPELSRFVVLVPGVRLVRVTPVSLDVALARK